MASGSMPGPGSGPPPAPEAPAAIHALDERVVNKIAAGEVIQRPASALKEMLENSLDAGSTQISVLVKEGGNKLLQIHDNGSGIRKEDLPILAHRHTTSKLKEFEDLETIGTLGFRGEALCSISFVSHMTVTTQTRDSLFGHRVMFKDSEMDPAGPKPVAGVPGTTISVEDLFYNIPTRKKALRSASEEYALVLDIVQRYAVYSTGVGFSLKRAGEVRADVNTQASASRLDNIRAVYGPAVSKELLPLSLAYGASVGPEVGLEDGMAYRVEGFMSGPNYAGKKSILVLFINGRCVESASLKRAVEGVYAAVLPKAPKPFLMLDVRLPPRSVEVNLHPTKREVGFLHQDEITDAIRSAIESRLLAANSSRSFSAAPVHDRLTTATAATQQQLLLVAPGPGGEPGGLRLAAPPTAGGGVGEEGGGPGSGVEGGGKPPVAYRPDKLVRVDHRTGTLDTFVVTGAARAAALAGPARKRTASGDPLPRSLVAADLLGLPPTALITSAYADGDDANANAAAANAAGAAEEEDDPPSTSGRDGQQPLRVRRAAPALRTQLDSVRELLEEAEGGCAEGLLAILKEHSLVGMADATRALLQHGTKLYLADVEALSRDMFYQLALRRWEAAAPLVLEPPPRVAELVGMGVALMEAQGTWQPSDGSPEELGGLVVELLSQKADMLREYLALTIDEQGRLVSLPVLLEGYAPDLSRLPDLIFALAQDVEWGSERECFQGLARALADFYAVQAPPPELPEGEGEGEEGEGEEQRGADGAAGPLGGGAVGASGGGGGEGQGGKQEGQQQGGVEGSGCPGPAAVKAAGAATGAGGKGGSRKEQLAAREWTIKNVVLPAMRACVKPPRARANDGTCVQVAALEKLYRIFERC